MADWTYSLLILPGFFAGLLLWSRISHLLQIFINTNTDSGSAEETSASAVRKQTLGIVAFIAAWLGIFGGLTFYFFQKPEGSDGWFWFFAGIAATPCIIVPPALYFWLRSQRRLARYDSALRAERLTDSTFTYEITFDEPYIRTLIDRYLQQTPTYPRPSIALILVNSFVAVWLILMPIREATLIGTAGIFILSNLSLLVVPWWTKRMLFSDLGYASHMGRRSTYTLSCAGLKVPGPRPLHQIMWPDLIKWPLVWKATRFADGMFLFGGGALAWLPDTALQAASPEDVTKFVSDRMQPRVVNEQGSRTGQKSLPKGDEEKPTTWDWIKISSGLVLVSVFALLAVPYWVFGKLQDACGSGTQPCTSNETMEWLGSTAVGAVLLGILIVAAIWIYYPLIRSYARMVIENTSVPPVLVWAAAILFVGVWLQLLTVLVTHAPPAQKSASAARSQEISDRYHRHSDGFDLLAAELDKDGEIVTLYCDRYMVRLQTVDETIYESENDHYTTKYKRLCQFDESVAVNRSARGIRLPHNFFKIGHLVVYSFLDWRRESADTLDDCDPNRFEGDYGKCDVVINEHWSVSYVWEPFCLEEMKMKGEAGC